MRLPRSIRRALWLGCACLLLLTPMVGAADPLLWADFDGDGMRDRVTIDHQEASVLQVWLSKTRSSEVVTIRGALLQVAAIDLDGDHRPELVASDTLSGVSVWKKHRRTGFTPFHPRVAVPHGVSRPNGRSFGDAQEESIEPLPETGGAQDSLEVRASQAVAVADRCERCSASPPRARLSALTIALTAPRPPPASRS